MLSSFDHRRDKRDLVSSTKYINIYLHETSRAFEEYCFETYAIIENPATLANYNCLFNLVWYINNSFIFFPRYLPTLQPMLEKKFDLSPVSTGAMFMVEGIYVHL